MDDCTRGDADGLPSRREFGRLLTRATILPVALSLQGGSSPAAPAADDRRCDQIPEDTYPYFTESDPALKPTHMRAEPDAAADGGGTPALPGAPQGA
jgi:hypothetical protein